MNCPLRRWPVLCLLAALALSGEHAVPQQRKDTIPAAKISRDSPRALGRLAGVQKLVEDAKWAAAVEEYQAILEEFGNDLVPLPSDPNHFISVRRYCQLRLAALPAPALRLVRERVDPLAKKWLDQGLAARDPVLLERIVQDAFVSRHTPRAIDMLGDLAFERGNFLEAEHYWRMLARPASAAKPAKDDKSPDLRLVFPDPEVEPALLRAKQILALLFRGDRSAVLTELKAFRTLHPQVAGSLAGRQGKYADILQALVERKELQAPPADDPGWPTFAGDAARSLVLPTAPRCRWLEEPWRARLDGREGKDALTFPEVTKASDANRALAFYPVVAGERVLVASARLVLVFELSTGKPLSRWELPRDRIDADEPRDSVRRSEKHTLTVAGDCVYARLGATAFAFPGAGKEKAPDSFLVCLQMDESGKLLQRWRVSAAQENEVGLFEGAPVIHAGRCYIARTRFTRTAAATAVDCYDADSGVRRWRHEICEAQELRDDGEPRFHPQLLTLAGANIVYCSHSGAVVALDAQSGRPAWAVRYPRRGYRLADGNLTPRDLCPAVYDSGQLFVAPADCDHIFCLDAGTGTPLWQSKPIEVVHLLGVAQGKLIVTTSTHAGGGIRAIDTAGGDTLRGWLQPEDGQDDETLAPMGRGLLAGDRVFWPTAKAGLQVLSLENGRPPDSDFVPLNGVRCGNLAAGNGCVVVAGQRELFGYVAPAKFLEERKKAAAAQPHSMPALVRLAVAEADAGRHDDAMRHFCRVAAEPGNLGETAARQAIRLFAISVNEDANAAFRRVQQALTPTVANRVPESLQLQASVRNARLSEPAVALATWQRILEDQRLRQLTLVHDQRMPQPAAAFAADRIRDLIKTQGVGIYQEHERAARKIATLAADGLDLQILDRLTGSYPTAAVTHESLQRAVARFERDKEYERAAHVNRQCLMLGAPADRAQALAKLALSYEGQNHWAAARDAWQRLAREHGDAAIELGDSRGLARALAAERLQRADFKASLTERLPRLPARFTQAWHSAFAPAVPQPLAVATERLLIPERAALDERCLFFRAEGSLTCRDAVTGHVRWQQPLSGTTDWLGRHADLVLVGGPGAVVALRQLDGKPAWHFGFAPTSREAAAYPGLTAFRMAGSRLFFLHELRRLIALDIETGLVLWSRAAPGASLRLPAGQYLPEFFADRQRVLIQSRNGGTALLDAATGAVIETRLSRTSWTRPPVSLDDRHVVVASDSRQLAMIESATGQGIWTHAIGRSASLTGEAPQVLGQGDTLLVCVARNFGSEVDRLNVKDGSCSWSRPILLPRLFPDLRHAAFDKTSLYLACEGTLTAYALADGGATWRLALPAGSEAWQVVAGANAILLYPTAATVHVNIPVLVRRNLPLDVTAVLPTLAFCPLGTTWTALTALRGRAHAPSKLPLLLVDPKTGKVMDQITLNSRGPFVRVLISDDRLTVALADTAYCFKASGGR